VDFEPPGDPEPDLIDAGALVDREFVDAAAGPDHLDDEVGAVLGLVCANDEALVGLFAGGAPGLQRPAAVRRQLDVGVL
jgi:hypothetical protein